MKPLVALTLLLLFGAGRVESIEPDNMKGMVDRHNYWRAKVHVPDLKWSNACAKVAQDWADRLAKEGCKIHHRPSEGKLSTDYGENIYWSMGMENKAADVVDDWASEIEFFDEKSGQCRGGVCGHYTQVVWKNTTAVGCGMAKCGDQEVWVCNYDPAGNWVGQKPY